ncbi:hypothetical protein [Oceanobacillus damuensis]|uniref:hypothetical protein n=1 Tax=Oceanobacillus damuensis TaxID=937928 RepID=UPI00082DEFF2|nr:hypothetical protein [Oceanobacillus damuensis]
MKLPDYMMEKLNELEELNKESKRLRDLAYPRIARKFPAKEINSETLLWLAIYQYQEYLEEKIQNYKIRLEEQKNNSCSNTSNNNF